MTSVGRFHGVMVITSDFDSDNLSSILSGTFFNPISINRVYFYARHLDCNNNKKMFESIMKDNRAHWSSSMILASGVSDPGFNSRMGPNCFTFGTDPCH